MIIDWINFTPYISLIGGILIGLAAVILMLVKFLYSVYKAYQK